MVALMQKHLLYVKPPLTKMSVFMLPVHKNSLGGCGLLTGPVCICCGYFVRLNKWKETKCVKHSLKCLLYEICVKIIES